MSRRSQQTKCCNCSVNFFPCHDSFGLYCSNKCQVLFQWKITKEKIERTGKIPKQHTSNNKTARRFLLETKGHHCSICLNTVWNNELIPLVLDHIDGNSDNWSLNNLRMICCNCDAQTPTYKSKNKGRGRYYRRLRYKQGKSY